MRKITSIDNIIEEGLRLTWDEGPEAALSLLCPYLQKEPHNARLHHALGIIHSSCTKNQMEAETHFRIAIQLDPWFAYSYWHLSKLLAEDQRHEAALEVYQNGIRSKTQIDGENEHANYFPAILSDTPASDSPA